jgi:hypothetical protein
MYSHATFWRAGEVKNLGNHKVPNPLADSEWVLCYLGLKSGVNPGVDSSKPFGILVAGGEGVGPVNGDEQDKGEA